MNIWGISIDPRDSKHVVNFIKDNIQDNDPMSFLHMKRFKKDSDHERLSVIICSYDYIDNQEDFDQIMAKANFKYEQILNKIQIPRSGPSTRVLSLEWSKKYWPLVWRGNPNDQILNGYIIDIKTINMYLNEITTIAQNIFETNKSLPIVTAFVNPLTKESIISIDHRHDRSLIDHSIMIGIRQVASKEKEARGCNGNNTDNLSSDSYLCLNFDVYTTHEPCSMCSMALIHSRIKRCIFIKAMDKTGCLKPTSGDSYCMCNNKSLNSKYETFQWIGDEYNLPEIDNNICC